MTEDTYNYLLNKLVEEVSVHPHREELLSLIADQLEDDTFVLSY
jgi:hypothetical protein